MSLAEIGESAAKVVVLQAKLRAVGENRPSRSETLRFGNGRIEK